MRKPNYVDQHVAARIRVRRNLLGLSQDELAKRLGVTAQQTQKYEAGETRVSASRLYAIAQHLGVPVSWFFEDLDSEEKTQAAEGTDRVEPDTEAPEKQVFEEIYSRREARELIETYFSIKDIKLRKRVLDMAELLTQLPE